ncbi:hypothetical protein M3J09_013446 [Ascochyta lentis]
MIVVKSGREGAAKSALSKSGFESEGPVIRVRSGREAMLLVVRKSATAVWSREGSFVTTCCSVPTVALRMSNVLCLALGSSAGYSRTIWQQFEYARAQESQQ